jgi:hypothetical protein
MTKEQIAKDLKEKMQKKGIKNKDIIKLGMPKIQLYSVLQIGKIHRPNYSIETYLKLLNLIEKC